MLLLSRLVMVRSVLCVSFGSLTDVTCVDGSKNAQPIKKPVVRWCPDGDFLDRAFPASRAQQISDLHSKFALGPHHMYKYGRHQ